MTKREKKDIFEAMKKKVFFLLLFILLLYAVYSLGTKRLQPSRPLPSVSGPIQFFNEGALRTPGEFAEEELAKESLEREEPTEEGSLSERLVIKRGSLSLLVKNTLEAVKGVQEAAEELGGFVLSSRTWYTDEKQERMKGEVTIKVPGEKFSEAMDKLKALALKVVSEQTSGQDVTEEYTDLESRLRNLEATETQLLEIMKRAGKISEVLEVQKELTRVREQIETTKGRMKYLEESAAMSTITVYIATEEEELPIVEERWRPIKVVKDALRSLVAFWQRVANILIWSAIFFSPFLVIGLIIWLIRKLRK